MELRWMTAVAAFACSPLVGWAMYRRRGALWAGLALAFYLGMFGARALRPAAVDGWAARHAWTVLVLLSPMTFFALLLVTPWPWWVAGLIASGLGAALLPLRARQLAQLDK